MLYEKKHVVVALVTIILIIGSIIFYFVWQSRPQYVIESNLNIKLPSTSEIVNYTYHNYGGHFKVKILVEKQSISALKDQLSERLGEAISVQEIDLMPNFENTCSWWDLKREDIEVCYLSYVSGKYKLFAFSPKTRIIWAFITNEKNGQYFLYISY